MDFLTHLLAAFFPSTEWCMQMIHNTPIAGVLVFCVSVHMTTFWIISGFLCEYQLTKLQERQKGPIQYGSFLLNRLLRLYPLYFIMSLAVYDEVVRVQRARGEEPQCAPTTLWRSLFFSANLFDASACVAMAWTVSVDVHGYLLIVLLFALFPEQKHWRKSILLTGYLVSLSYMAHEYFSMNDEGHDFFHQNGLLGSQHLSDRKRSMVDLTKHLDTPQYWPDTDFTSPHAQMLQDHYEKLLRLYHTSIHKHGSAMLLGSYLYMDLRDRQWKSQYPFLKVMVAVVWLFLTRARFCFSGVGVWLLLDVLLTIESNTTTGGAMLSLFSNRLWTALAPFTYGIYLTHMIPMGYRAAHRSVWRIDELIKKGRDACEGYNQWFILREAVINFVIASFIAFVLHYTVEWPFTYIRRRWCRKSKESTE